MNGYYFSLIFYDLLIMSYDDFNFVYYLVQISLHALSWRENFILEDGMLMSRVLS